MRPYHHWMTCSRSRISYAAGERALQEPVLVALPFREAGYLSPHEPAAVAYRVELRRGQRLVVEVTLQSGADWYRVALPDGTRGYLIARAAEAIDSPIRRHQPAAPTLVRHRPDATAPPIADIEPGARVPVLGEYEDRLFVRLADGRAGWNWSAWHGPKA